MLPGEAGIGKTTLWLAGIDAATARGYRILSCRPSEAETRFAFAGLAELLGDAARDVLPELPPIQRRAASRPLGFVLHDYAKRKDVHPAWTAIRW